MWSQSFTSSAACRSFWIKTLSSVPPLSVLQGKAPYRFVYSYFELIAVLIPQKVVRSFASFAFKLKEQNNINVKRIKDFLQFSEQNTWCNTSWDMNTWFNFAECFSLRRTVQLRWLRTEKGIKWSSVQMRCPLKLASVQNPQKTKTLSFLMLTL